MFSFERSQDRARRKAEARITMYEAEALEEVSTRLGGEGLATKIVGVHKIARQPDSPYAENAAFTLLDDLFPGSIDEVMRRSGEIMHEAHGPELNAINNQKNPFDIGRALLQRLIR